MGNPLKSDAARDLGLLAARVPLGTALVLRGVQHFVYTGLGRFVLDCLGFLPFSGITPLARAGLYMVPFLEVAAGVMLIVGCYTRIAAAVAAWILLTVSIAVTGIFVTHDQLSPDIVYLGITLLILVMGPGSASLDAKMKGWRRRRR